MKNFYLAPIVAAFWLIGVTADSAAAGQFVPGIVDLPLMAGLVAKPESTLHYDTPSGRIVDVHASGNLNRLQVAKFYSDTLPQLGWMAMSPGVYRRDDEILKIVIKKSEAGPISVRFSLVPASASEPVK